MKQTDISAEARLILIAKYKGEGWKAMPTAAGVSPDRARKLLKRLQRNLNIPSTPMLFVYAHQQGWLSDD